MTREGLGHDRGGLLVCAGRVVVGWALALATPSCAGAPPPPPAEPPPPPPPKVEPPPPTPHASFATELGSIDEHDTESAFRQLDTSFMACHAKGLRRVRALGGEIQFFVRVTEDGTAKFAFVEKSTLGDRDTERCMVEHVLHARWPKPRGGDAEVRKRIELEPPSDARKPAEWPAARIEKALAKFGGPMRKCKAGVSGSFALTAYVQPKGARGAVVTAGAAPPNHEADGKIDCLVKEAKRIPMPPPGRSGAKVYFVF